MKGIKFNPSYAKVKNAPKEDVAMSYGQLDIKKEEFRGDNIFFLRAFNENNLKVRT